jgi:hypothetical protein
MSNTLEGHGMPTDELNYRDMMRRAFVGVMAEALSVVARAGLPPGHHFYITIDMRHPGVDAPDWLLERYPDEMMIVLEHEYEQLVVTNDRFSVSLSFNDLPARIVTPFDAVRQFADPSVEFGLRFDAHDDDAEADVAKDAEDTPPPPTPDAPISSGGSQVISLDQHRKK